MTAPDMLLSRARAVLDQLEQQARAAVEMTSPYKWVDDTHEPGSFWPEQEVFMRTWSPSFVLTVVGMLRATVDGWERVLDRHYRVPGETPTSWHAMQGSPDDYCGECGEGWPCLDVDAALAGLERLASLGLPEQSEAAAGDLQ